jgi:hypothetical protein
MNTTTPGSIGGRTSPSPDQTWLSGSKFETESRERVAHFGLQHFAFHGHDVRGTFRCDHRPSDQPSPGRENNFGNIVG